MELNEILNTMKLKYHESEKEINYIKNLNLTKEGWRNINNMSFIVITNDTFKINELKFCLDKLRELDAEIINMKYLNGISEYSLIEHYKYHSPEPILKMDPEKLDRPYQSSVPSVGWPIVRKRFSKPLIACLLRGKSNTFNKEVLKVKGSTNPKNCINKEIRSKAPNIAFTLMHSSDDIYSVLRESIIFLGEDTVINSVNNSKLIDNDIIKKNERLLYVYDLICKLTIPSLENVINKLKQKIIWYILMNYSEIESFKYGLRALEFSVANGNCDKIDEYVDKKLTEDNDLVKIYKLFLDNKLREHKLDINKIMTTIRNKGLVEDEWNDMLLQSYFSLLN